MQILILGTVSQAQLPVGSLLHILLDRVRHKRDADYFEDYDDEESNVSLKHSDMKKMFTR